jgi:hypothetical protein
MGTVNGGNPPTSDGRVSPTLLMKTGVDACGGTVTFAMIGAAACGTVATAACPVVVVDDGNGA